MIGVSWLGVDVTLRPSLPATSQAQPDPKRVAAAFENSLWKASNEPNAESIALLSAALLAPWLGDITCQNNTWLAKPPPLFLTAVRIFSGTELRSLRISAMDNPERAVPPIAAFKLLVYAACVLSTTCRVHSYSDVVGESF